MSRRQKGPTTEELLEKLDKRFTEYQETNDANLDKFKEETKEFIERLDTESKDYASTITQEISSLKDEIQKDHVLFEEKHLEHFKTFNDTQESVSGLAERQGGYSSFLLQNKIKMDKNIIVLSKYLAKKSFFSCLFSATSIFLSKIWKNI